MLEVIDSEFVAGLTGLGGIPFIAALVNLVKPFVPDSRFYPLVSLVFGVAWNVGAYAGLVPDYTNVGWTVAVVQGVAVGLAASGAYEINRMRMQ